MFCRNCGYNMGDAKQCPKCGTFIPEYDGTQAEQNQPAAQQMTQEEQQTVGSEMNQQPTGQQMNQQPASQQVNQQTGQPANQQGQKIQEEYTVGQYQNMLNQESQNQDAKNQAAAFGPNNNFYQNYQNGMQSGQRNPIQPKKKKKWPIVVAIVAVICLVLGAGTYFAFPYIQDATSPKKQAVTALKNSCSEFQSKISTSLDKSTNNATDTKKKLSGEFTLDKTTVEGSDYLTYLKVDTIAYEIDVDTLTQEMSGTMNLKHGSKGTSQLEISFYSDGNTLYVRIPQLFNESLEVSMSDLFSGTDYQSSYSGLAKMLGGMDNLTITKYSGAINAAVKDAVEGLNVMIDNCEYEKTDSINMDSDQGSQKVSVFNVTVTPNAVCKGLETMIDKMYDDSELSAYMTLLSTYTGTSKEEMKDSIWEGYPDMNSVQLTLYVTKDNKIVRFLIDDSASQEEVRGTIDYSCVIDNKITDVYTLEFRIEDDSITSIKGNSGKSSSGKGGSTKYQSNKTTQSTSGSTSSIVYKISFNKDHITLDEFSMVLYTDDNEKVEVSLSGNYNVSESGSLKLSKSNFVNPINVESMTQAQATSLYNQINQNSYIIRNIISDSLYNALMR